MVNVQKQIWVSQEESVFVYGNTLFTLRRRRLEMERPMTTKEFFNKICRILKEKGRLPDILDYGVAAGDPLPIRTYPFDLKHNLAYGSSEGIYLDLRIGYPDRDEECRRELGTFKTLRDDREAMHIMAALLADFILEGYAYVNANLDNFTWEGADVRGIKANGQEEVWAYSCDSMEQALKRKDELLEKYPEVSVRDNATRKETRWVAL